MKQFLNVIGSQESVPNLEVNVDTVYVRDNIKRIEEEFFKGWEYDEIQYTLREYQEVVGNKAEILKLDMSDVAEIVAMTIEDTSSLADLISYLIERNSDLQARLENLEKGSVLND